MSDLTTLWRSFAGGEISPELHARLDLQKFQTGLALCRNFIVLPHGPAVNRPGTEYVLETKDSTKRSRLIPFSVSATVTFILEIGHLYMRFHSNNGTIVETAKNITAITKANPGVVTSAAHGYSNGQWIFLSGIGGMTQLNSRFVKVASAAADTFALQDLGGSNIDTSNFGTYTSGGTAQRVHEIVTPYSESAIDLLTIHYAQSNDVLTLTHPTYDPRELRRITSTNWTLNTISFDPSLAAPANVAAINTQGTGPRDYTYAVTALTDEGEESFLSASDTIANALWTNGFFNTITWDAVAGAARYNVYRENGGLFSFIGQTIDETFVDQNIEPDTTTTPPEQANPFSGAGNFPGTATYIEQRRVFAGTNNKPQNVWFSRTGTEANMSGSTPSRDDDSIAFRIASRELSTILHVVPLEDLILLTLSAAWRVYSKNSDSLTPSTVSAKPTTYIGAANVQPIVTGNSILYVAALGSHLCEMRYSWEQNGYQVKDASIMAPHLLTNDAVVSAADYTIVDAAFATAPYKTCWCVRSDGKLLGVTYVPEHDVLAWQQHDTLGGEFESVATVREGKEDATYFIVKRTINGRTVRYVERLHTRRFTAQADAYFVDAGESYSGVAISTLSGLWHLEGQKVAVLADGAEHPQVTVSNGSITLQNTASVIQAGLPIEADLQTLPLAFESSSFGQGIQKNVNNVFVRLYRTSRVKAGPTFDRLTELPQRTNEPYGSPPALVSGVHEIVIEGSWSLDGQLCMRQSAPLPVTVQSFALGVALGD